MGRFLGELCVVVSLGCAAAGPAWAQSPPTGSTATGVLLEPREEHFAVALHARSVRGSARAEQAAWLTVTLPLDELALPRIAQQPHVPIAAEPAPAPVELVAAAPDAGAAPLVSFEQLRTLTEFSRRATVVALAVAGAALDRRRLDSIAARARSSALLPELRLRAVRNTDQALRWVPTTDDPYRITQADGAGLTLEASATFRLDRLLFAREELAVERLRQRAGEARLKLEARVQSAVLGLFRAHELGCAGERDPVTPSDLMRGLELFQELDNLTAGWFSEQAPSFGRAVWGFPEAVLGVCSAPEPPSAGAAAIPVASLADSE
jgi:hypothetical protein